MAELKGRMSIGKGDKGDRGPIGPQGPPGRQGIQGPQGIPGPQGIQGETGATGPRGPQGTPGTGIQFKGSVARASDLQGKIAGAKIGDAYYVEENKHIYVFGDNGKFNDVGQIQGPPGKDGADGAPGKNGATGATGPQGPRGNDGRDGKTIKFFEILRTQNYQRWTEWATQTIQFDSTWFSDEMKKEINIGDIIGVTGRAVDKQGMRMNYFAEAVNKSQGTLGLKGLGFISNLNDATGGGGSVDLQNYYTKGESNDKFEAKLVTRNLDSVGADCNKVVDAGKYKFANHVKNTPYDQKCHGILEHIKYDNHWCQLATVVSIIDKAARTDERWIRYLTDFSKKTWSEWKEIATTDDITTTKVMKYKDNIPYNTYKSNVGGAINTWTKTNFDGYETVKKGDYVVITDCSVSDRTGMKITMYGQIVDDKGSLFKIKFFGMSESNDAYSKTEIDSKLETTLSTKQEIYNTTNLDNLGLGIYQLVEQERSPDHPSFPKGAIKYGILEVVKSGVATRQIYTATVDNILGDYGAEIFIRTKFDRHPWTTWERIDNQHGAKIIRKTEFAGTYSSYLSWINTTQQIGANNFTGQDVKTDDFVILCGQTSDKVDMAMFMKVNAISGSTYPCRIIGISSNTDPSSFAKKAEVIPVMPNDIDQTIDWTGLKAGIYRVILKGSGVYHPSFPSGAHPYGILEVIINKTATRLIYTANKDSAGNDPELWIRNKFDAGWSNWEEISTKRFLTREDNFKQQTYRPKVMDLHVPDYSSVQPASATLEENLGGRNINNLPEETTGLLENRYTDYAAGTGTQRWTTDAGTVYIRDIKNIKTRDKHFGEWQKLVNYNEMRDKTPVLFRHPSPDASDRKSGKLTIPTVDEGIPMAMEWHEIDQDFGSGGNAMTIVLPLGTQFKNIFNIQVTGMKNPGGTEWDEGVYQANITPDNGIEVKCSKGGRRKFHLLVIGQAK